jgi:hypothetical protein
MQFRCGLKYKKQQAFHNSYEFKKDISYINFLSAVQIDSTILACSVPTDGRAYGHVTNSMLIIQ